MSFQAHLKSITQDAIIWLALQHWGTAITPIAEQEATRKIVHLIISIPNQIKRDTYTKNITEEIARINDKKVKRCQEVRKQITKLEKNLTKEKDEDVRKIIVADIAELEKEHIQLDESLLPILVHRDLVKYVKDEIAERAKEQKARQRSLIGGDDDDNEVWDDDTKDPWQNCPKWIDKSTVKEKGFSLVNSPGKGGALKRFGYYTYNPETRTHTEITNFSFTPIFHNYKAENSRYILEIDNGYKKAVIDIDAQTLVSPDKMLTRLAGEGNFVIYGSKNAFLRVASELLQNFVRCLEITAFGWQHYGFYAYIDRIFVPGSGAVVVDEWGVCKHDGENYLLPPSSAAVRALKKTAEDPYEQERALSYIESPINISKWVAQMIRVYGNKGLTAASYAFMCAFRDILFDVDANFPHLYGVGEAGSGKSKWGASVSAFFFHKRSGFNLNSGTDYAFNRYVSQFINTASLLNEFDEKAVRDEWFQQIKGFYDGEGRMRGSMQKVGKIENMKVQSGIVLMGQYLVTKDDNSVVTRCLIEQFHVVNNRTAEDNKAYDYLTDLQEQGMTSLITAILPYRAEFKKNYKDKFNEHLSRWRALYHELAKSKENYRGNFNQRIVQNWCHAYTAMFMINEKLNFDSFKIGHFENYCFESAAYWCRFIRSSDTLSEFWNTFAYLVDKGVVKDRWDYKIDVVTSIMISSDNDTVMKQFNEPTKVLYLRLNNIHKEYQMAYRQRTNNIGMNVETLTQYFKSRAYFVGHVKNTRFTRGEDSRPSSCFAFSYEDIGIDIENIHEEAKPFSPGQNPQTDLF